MTIRSVRIHPAALEETEAAIAWYEQRSGKAAEMLLDELDQAIKRASENPGQFPLHEYGTRRIVLRRFPYLVIFRETDTSVEIIAVAHGRRRPGYWQDRVE